MTKFRTVKYKAPSVPVTEGAGVHLMRGVGFHEVPSFDPFLLLDDFHSRDPHDYLPGFPWHPHRGIETVTYVLRGDVEHGDSIGNRGAIRDGDVQWMTAGSGIIHQEMPQRYSGDFRGFQLWVNLPASHKMMDPRYRDVPAHTIPTAEVAEGVGVKVIAGEVEGVVGPVRDIVRPPEYFDVTLAPGTEFVHQVPAHHTVFIYVIEGAVTIAGEEVGTDTVALTGEGDALGVSSGDGARFLLFTGEPLNEPVAWRGPIVMNTQEELDLAFYEYQQGTFIKTGMRR